jgi:N-acetylated-alpha-linked acidic dipeptidase
VGLLLYSDPEEDGYYRGDVYPDGPMRPPYAVQRGSVLNANGDPTTPGRASVPGVLRLPEESLPVPRIPVMPLGYGNARRLLDALGGPSVPQDWQGALPFRYHVGPGPLRARLVARRERGERAMHDITNTFAVLRGARWPDEWIVVGAHLDAWTPGGEDNVSGSAVVLEAARTFAELARQGIRPARTLIFATWDAEEWGLIGSTEWVEEQRDSLLAHVVAYVNEDAVVSGPDFDGSASPSLKRLFRAVSQAVPDPAGHGTVYDAWIARHGRDTLAARLGNLGGGSDFQGFYHHLGIPAGGVGFEGPSGNYHSMYDSYHWMATFGDPEFRRHRAVAQIVALAAWRLANEAVLPLDYEGWGREMRGLVAELDSALARRHWTVSTAPLREALDAFAAAGQRVRQAAAGHHADASLRAANAALMRVERRLTRPEGLVGRSWYKSLQFASDLDRGYQTLAFPSVQEAIRYADEATAARELGDLIARLGAARAALDAATAALR